MIHRVDVYPEKTNEADPVSVYFHMRVIGIDTWQRAEYCQGHVDQGDGQPEATTCHVCVAHGLAVNQGDERSSQVRRMLRTEQFASSVE